MVMTMAAPACVSSPSSSAAGAAFSSSLSASSRMASPSSTASLPAKELLPVSTRFTRVANCMPLATRARTLLMVRASSAAVVSAPPAEAAAINVPRLKAIYLNKAVPGLKEEFKYSNNLEIPRLKKVVVNCGIGEASQNAKVLETAMKDIATVTGQKPVITRAKKAIAGFKIRQGMPVGIAVTLRGEVMYSFLDRVLNLVLPRTRDFLGVNPYSFDGRGNYHLGLKEQGVFPEIRFDNIDKPRGMDISIITTARTDKEGQRLLTLIGMPFKSADASKRVPVVRRKKGRYNIKSSKGGGKGPSKGSKKK